MFQNKQVPILFSIERSPYSDSFAQSSAHLPLLYQSSFASENLKLNYLDLVEAGENMTGLLDVIDQHLEEITRGQAFSMRYHCGRITASRLYEVIHTDPHKPAISLVISICYPQSKIFLLQQQNMVVSMKSKLLLPTSLEQQRSIIV